MTKWIWALVASLDSVLAIVAAKPLLHSEIATGATASNRAVQLAWDLFRGTRWKDANIDAIQNLPSSTTATANYINVARGKS
jgi:hypothetical protein